MFYQQTERQYTVIKTTRNSEKKLQPVKRYNDCSSQACSAILPFVFKLNKGLIKDNYLISRCNIHINMTVGSKLK